MALAAGTLLGPYEITVPIGAGGMGEVYRAHDRRLHRDVAVKVLPLAVAADRDRLRRFEQEAHAVAALNHPNILALYDIGEASGLHFIVSELLDGEPLRDKLADGPLPARRAIDLAVQIARGLAAAHDKGIVHRDLKPENIFVTNDARVKILDFGLAKPIDAGQPGRAPATMMATVAGGTEPGLVLGTVGYMSPEQVRGESVDHRTDIFSFGAVLYELVSGRRAFKRDTAAETMTAILKDDPPELAGAGTPIPPGLERIVRRALEKSPGERFQSAKDLGFALDAVGGPSTMSAIRVEHGGRRFRPIAAALAALALAAAGVAGYLAGNRGAAGSPVFARLTFQRGYVKGARFTPDGRNIVYSAMWEGRHSARRSRRAAFDRPLLRHTFRKRVRVWRHPIPLRVVHVLAELNPARPGRAARVETPVAFGRATLAFTAGCWPPAPAD